MFGSRCRRVVAVLAAGLLLGSAQPGHAAHTAAAFEGTLEINCYGCGVSSGSFEGLGAGVVDGSPFGVEVLASLWVTVPPFGGDLCLPAVAPIEGYVAFRHVLDDGYTYGSFFGNLTMTTGYDGHYEDPQNPLFAPATAAVLATVVFETGGSALMEFGGPLVSPVGPPCGGPVMVTIEGALAGA